MAGHLELAGSVAGDLGLVLDALTEAVTALPGRRPDTGPWRERLRDRTRAAVAGDRELLDSPADPIHPARVYGELLAVLADDAVVIGDGGDFVSFAGRFVEPAHPGTGSTRDPTAAWAPASATPSRPAWPAPRPRSCSCWATARPGSP